MALSSPFTSCDNAVQAPIRAIRIQTFRALFVPCDIADRFLCPSLSLSLSLFNSHTLTSFSLWRVVSFVDKSAYFIQLSYPASLSWFTVATSPFLSSSLPRLREGEKRKRGENCQIFSLFSVAFLFPLQRSERNEEKICEKKRQRNANRRAWTSERIVSGALTASSVCLCDEFRDASLSRSYLPTKQLFNAFEKCMCAYPSIRPMTLGFNIFVCLYPVAKKCCWHTYLDISAPGRGTVHDTP